MGTIKHSIGIDVSKDSLVCCIGTFDEDDQQAFFSKSKPFPNTLEGFNSLTDWIGSTGIKEAVFIMEATGVYYENLAYWLDAHDELVSVVLPNKIKHYVRSLNIKTKTDDIDARNLSRFGLERKSTGICPLK